MLSVVINTFNEAGMLKRVVGSVRNIADEIVVVDTQSTDDTVDVAKKLGCVVYTHPNVGIVELVRNFSIKKAKGDWILLLDADEEVSPELADFIKNTIAEDRVDYCRIARQNIIFDKWIKSGHWWPDYVYRLFKKGSITWQETIHSIPITTGTGFDFPAQEKLSLIHHNYQDITQFVNRLNRYTAFQAEGLISSGTKFHWLDLVRQPTAEFLTQYFSRAGYKEGLHGLVLSLLQAFSQFVVYLKIWEKEGFKKDNINLAGLNHEVKKNLQDYQWWYWETRINNSGGILKIYWKLRRRLKI